MNIIKIQKEVIQDARCNPIVELEEKINVIERTVRIYEPNIDLFKAFRANELTTTEDVINKSSDNIVYTIIDYTAKKYIEIDLVKQVNTDFNKIHERINQLTVNKSNNDIKIFINIFDGLHLEITPRQFRKLSLLKSITFGEKMFLVPSSILETPDEISKLTTFSMGDETDDDNMMISRVDAYVLDGPLIIRKLCMFLMENQIRRDFLKDFNSFLEDTDEMNTWYTMSDVFIEFVTGDKIKMSFDAFSAIYNGVVGVEKHI